MIELDDLLAQMKESNCFIWELFHKANYEGGNPVALAKYCEENVNPQSSKEQLTNAVNRYGKKPNTVFVIYFRKKPRETQSNGFGPVEFTANISPQVEKLAGALPSEMATLGYMPQNIVEKNMQVLRLENELQFQKFKLEQEHQVRQRELEREYQDKFRELEYKKKEIAETEKETSAALEKYKDNKEVVKDALNDQLGKLIKAFSKGELKGLGENKEETEEEDNEESKIVAEFSNYFYNNVVGEEDLKRMIGIFKKVIEKYKIQKKHEVQTEKEAKSTHEKAG
jgi:hypothetical protein